RSFWSLLLPWPGPAFALYVISAVAVLAVAVQCWRSGRSLEIRYAALSLATVLVSPHLTVYDLVILAPAFLLLGEWALRCGKSDFAGLARLLLYLCYPLFLLGPLARVTHLQLSVIAMIALLWITGQIGTQAHVRVSS